VDGDGDVDEDVDVDGDGDGDGDDDEDEDGLTSEGEMILLSVDPGANTGWALFVDLRLSDSGRIRAPYYLGAKEFLVEKSVDHLVVEGQYFLRNPDTAFKRGDKAAPWSAVVKLLEKRFRWQHAAEELDIPCEIVPPGTWIPALTKGLPGSTKDGIKIVVEARFGRKFRADEMDAVGLGLWWIQDLKARGL
jgi:hypothetical protein